MRLEGTKGIGLHRIMAVCVILFCVGNLKTVAWQPQDEEQRDIYYDYSKVRPKKPTGASATRVPRPISKATRRYVRKTPRLDDSTRNSNYELLGITIWRLRPSSAADDREIRILEQEEGVEEGTEMTPVRMEAGGIVSAGDHVRITIESPRTGYLYVVDREQYAEGTLSDPYLIFPNLLTRGGDNRVQAGMLVDLPANGNRPSSFRLKPSRPDQIGERLTILVTPQPLKVPPLGRKLTRLSKNQTEQWEKMWGTQVERYELEGGSGQRWTKEEKAASTDEKRLLYQDDPGPQTIYRVTVKPGNPLLVTVLLRYNNAP